MPLDDVTAIYERQSPQLLAEQPPSPPENLPKQGKDWPDIFSHLEARLSSMRNWRWSWWSYWSILAQYVLPRRYHWVIVPNRMARGAPINNSIIDSTATLSMQICASGLWTGLTNPARPWFELGTALPGVDLDADGQAWLEDTQDKVYTVLGRSNFYNTMAQAFQDVVTFGTAPVIIYEDEIDVIRCYLPCAGEYFLAVGSRFSNDVLYREFTLTVAQIVEMFGIDHVPKDISLKWKGGGGQWETEYVIAHAIEPNSDLSSRSGKGRIRVVAGALTFREIYWVRGVQEVSELSRRGFHSRPFMVARWAVVSNDPYGRSPAMDALGDTKQLQLETIRKAEFIEKGVRPPMGANPELKNEPSSILPGNITYTATAEGKKGFWPLFEVNANWLTGLTADIEKVSARIKECFFVPLFMAITNMQGVQPRNELELTKRDLERLQVLGPFITLFETEFADPAIQRVLEILERNRLLSVKPKSLHGVPLKISYTSIMRLAQLATENIAMKDVFATMGELSSAAKAAGVPDPIRVIDLDKSARKYASRANFPADCLFTEQEVKEHDQARQQAQAAATATNVAPAAVDAAKTLSDTNIGGPSALTALLGTPSGLSQ